MAGRRQQKAELVRYCPGDAPGSPAGMTRGEAERQGQRDADYLERMQAVSPVANWPHINGSCSRCRPLQSQGGP